MEAEAQVKPEAKTRLDQEKFWNRNKYRTQNLVED